jgi:hypothetical protein
VLLFINKFGYNVPYWDEWENVRFFKDVLEQDFSFSDAFTFHNEHRVFSRALYSFRYECHGMINGERKDFN